MSLDPMSSGESEKNQVEKLVKGSDGLNTSVNSENNTMVSERSMQRKPNDDMDIYECSEASGNTQNAVNAFDACENVQMVSDQGSEHNIPKVVAMHDHFEASDNIRNAVNISNACGNGQTVSNISSENAVEMDDCLKDDNTIENVMHASDTCENQQTVSERVSGSVPWKVIEMDECFKAFDGTQNVLGTPDACENGHMASEGLSKSRPHKVDIEMDESFEGSADTQNVANASEEIKQIVLEQISEVEERKAVEMVDNGGKQTTVEVTKGAQLAGGDIDTDGSPCIEIPGKELGIGSASSACETEPGINLGNQYPFDVREGYKSGSRLPELQRNPEIQLREFGENPGYRLLDDGQTKLWQECDRHSEQKLMDSHNYSLVAGKSLDSIHKQESPNQESCTTALVSTNLEGWQRFDIEDNDARMAYVAGGHPRQGQELWEQLLEDALETNQKDIDLNVPERVSAFSLYEGNQSWLASPGNPFIEGTARTSNFLEIESLSMPTFQRTLMNAEEESFQNSYGNRDPLSVNGSYAISVDKLQTMPELSGIPLDAVNPASLRSVMNLESHALYNGANNVSGHETWEANFDAFMPISGPDTFVSNMHGGTQEPPRSLSLPRMVDEMPRGRESEQEGHRWSFSVASDEPGTPSMAQSKKQTKSLHAALGFMSPHVSPLVKKVVKSIQTSPVIGKKTLKNGARSTNNRSTNVAEKSKKPVWMHCICCSKID